MKQPPPQGNPSSTLTNGATAFHPGLGGPNDTATGPGLIPKPNLSDSPPKRARNDKKSSRGSMRNDFPKDLNPTFSRDFTKLTDAKKLIMENGKLTAGMLHNVTMTTSVTRNLLLTSLTTLKVV